MSGIDRIKTCDMKSIVVLHYTGHKKPWRLEFSNQASIYYWNEVYHQGNKAEAIAAFWFIFKTTIRKTAIGKLFRKLKRVLRV